MEEPRLVCPDCQANLVLHAHAHLCRGCGMRWPDEDGFPKLFRERDVHASDRFMRLFYNGLPALHDPLTRHVLPWLQRDCDEPAMRRQMLAELELESLAEVPRGAPVHILEIGIGAGANLPFVAECLPSGLDVVYWGLDLSRGMLAQCRKRLPYSSLDVRLSLGDAHRLPFPDGCFDRVFHIGAIASYGQPQRALAEMGRVARRATPIVVVDEQLDPRRRNSLRDRLAFRLLTFYDRKPRCPVDKLPHTASDIRTTQPSRFFYCLRFSIPSAHSRP